MFESIRKHNKILMGMLFLLIVPSFVLLGVGDYGRPAVRVVVAEVDGREITQAEWDAAHRNEVDRLRAAVPTLDVKLLDTPEAKYATLERMVRDRVAAAAAERLGLGVSNQRLARELQAEPQIAALRKADGTLDIERYQELLRAQGMTAEMFEANVRADLSARQVLQGIAGSALAPDAVADVALGAYFEQRAVQIARFAPSDYAARLQPTDEQLQAYYQDNTRQFMQPESVDVQYLVLDSDAVAKTINIGDADLRAYYEQNAQRLAGNEERRVSHILINAPESASRAEREAARAKAGELLAQLRRAPGEFAALARAHSQDTGSASAGGDLGFFSRGAMVKPFEDAAFALAENQISELVETEFGYHIIRVTEIKRPTPRSFEAMKPELLDELRRQQLQVKYAEAAEQFTNAVYEQPDSLQPAAERLKLEIRTASDLGRTPAPGAQGPLADPKLRAALFSSEATEKKRNTEAIDVGGGTLVAARVTQHRPAQALPFAQVREQVRSRWLATRGAEEARQDGQAKLAEWQAKPQDARLGASQVVSRAEARNIAPALLNAALQADPKALPQFKGVDLGEQGYAVVMVERVLPRQALPQPQAQQARAQYTQWWSSAEGQAYLKWLEQRFKARIKVDKPAPTVAG